MTSLKAVAVAGLSVLLTGTAAAQTQAASTPVGFETITIDQTFNYMGLRLVGSAIQTGSVTNTNNSLTFANGTIPDGPVVVEVGSGTAQGAVVAGTASGNAVTVAAGVGGDIATGDTVTIRQAQTLASVFGAAGENLDGAAGQGAADLVLVPDGMGGFDTYFYATAGFTTAAGWRQVVNGVATEVDANNVVLVYTDGVVVQNRQGNNSIVVTGTVPTASASLALTSTFNYLGTVFPVGSTLSTAFDDPQNPGTLRDGTLTGAAGQGAADLVLVPEGSGFNTYFYATAGFTTPAGWRQVASDGTVSNADSTMVSLDGASSIIIQNRGDSRNVTINAPGFYSNL